MFVWKIDFIERHIMGYEKWDANVESGYAAEVDGVMFEVVDRAEDAEKFKSREDAEDFRDNWLREFDASSGTVEVSEDGEFHDVQVLSSWELVEL